MVTVRGRSKLHIICFSRDVRRTGRPPPCSPHVNVDVAHPTPKPTHWGSLPAPKLVALVSDISTVYTKSRVLCTEIRNQRHGICSGKTSPLSHVTGLECGYQIYLLGLSHVTVLKFGSSVDVVENKCSYCSQEMACSRIL